MFRPAKMLTPLRLNLPIMRFASKSLARKLLRVPRIEIGDGKILYLQIKIYIHGETAFARTIIRGWRSSSHEEIYNAVRANMESLGLCTQSLGGGKMVNDHQNQKINIYGFCKTFGKADHYKTKQMLQSWSQYQKYDIEIGPLKPVYHE
ncbi:sex-regulated protein janus-B-like [Scaptodrosophila lebanonensis]|uniref:Sex-regulated protein janus-B-like n=1 Tax=Drosophila lebanonensis TaxID=7225 RepID=A0A6J2T619_DROLE|nr:sex-regulated protein janus-B-like [Scaptodrosophila lebanonensis]